MASSKELDKITLAQLGQLFPIIIEDYSDKWVGFYQSESNRIMDSFAPAEIVRIDHIGSTAIPGLKAKPTIDILLQVSEDIDIDKMKRVFKSLGYQLNERPENPPPHVTFVKGYTKNGIKGQSYHVHIRYKGDWNEIRFRDYLIHHPEIAKEYENIKLQLAAQYRNDREAYTAAKTDFIEKINKVTRK